MASVCPVYSSHSTACATTGCAALTLGDDAPAVACATLPSHAPSPNTTVPMNTSDAICDFVTNMCFSDVVECDRFEPCTEASQAVASRTSPKSSMRPEQITYRKVLYR